MHIQATGQLGGIVEVSSELLWWNIPDRASAPQKKGDPVHFSWPLPEVAANRLETIDRRWRLMQMDNNDGSLKVSGYPL